MFRIKNRNGLKGQNNLAQGNRRRRVALGKGIKSGESPRDEAEYSVNLISDVKESATKNEVAKIYRTKN